MNSKSRSLSRIFLISLFALAGGTQPQASERTIPPLTGPVIDEVGFLTPEIQETISQAARSLSPNLQLQLWVIKSLEGEVIESVALRAVDQWKLGMQGTDRGALLLIALKERKIRIEVGRGLEGDVPDARASRIIRDIIAPSLREGNAEGAILGAYQEIARLAGVTASFQDTRSTNGVAPAGIRLPKKRATLLSILFVLFMLSGFILRLMSRFGGIEGLHHVGRHSRGPWSSGSWSGGSGGSWGGGWSGGGGGFSGGGASGGW